VPPKLVPIIGQTEINRSLETSSGSCPREWCKSDVIVELSGEVDRLIVRQPQRAA